MIIKATFIMESPQSNISEHNQPADKKIRKRKRKSATPNFLVTTYKMIEVRLSRRSRRAA